MLLEREAALTSLEEYAAAARDGDGRIVLIAGEAGAGKSALVDALRDRVPDLRWLWGACDGSFTPEPLRPLFDIANQLDGALADACRDDSPRDRLFRILLEQLKSGPPTAVVVEDGHWADESTLDLIAFLGRRLRNTPTLLIVTYRDDGLASNDPLRITVGELATQQSARRVGLPPLSEDAVSRLAVGSGLDPRELHTLTSGNPFFVTQAIEAGETSVPPSARAAVMARVVRLPADARITLESAAVIGTRVALAVLCDIAGQSLNAVELCLNAGMLVSDADGVRFRHEIARLALEESLLPHRRVEMNRRALEVFTALDRTDHARLAHHADAAGDSDAVLQHAPAAAWHAAGLAAHWVSALQFERAVRFADDLPVPDRARLYDALAAQYALIDQWDQAAAALRISLELWRAEGDRLRTGDCLRLLGRASWRLCDGEAWRDNVEAAVTVLAAEAPSIELGWALNAVAGYRNSHGLGEDARSHAQRARGIAEQFDDSALLSEALNTEGCSHDLPDEALTLIRKSLDVALSAGLDSQAGRAFANLQAILAGEHRYAEAEQLAFDGLAYCEDHDIGTYSNCLHGGRVQILDDLGWWDEAMLVHDRLDAQPNRSPINRLGPLTAVARIQARRGRSAAVAQLAEATDLAAGCGVPGYVMGVALARLEFAWLAGDDEATASAASDIATLAPDGDPWVDGSRLTWLRRVGSEVPASGQAVAPPYIAELGGDWQRAAELWLELGCRYDAALALFDSDHEHGLRQAIDLFDGLDAGAAVTVAAAKMRRLGVKAIPRGRRSATRADPFGLTPREREVLDLIAVGMTNAEVAGRLFIAEKTVGHHVSAILAKLGVDSRRAAARILTESGRSEESRDTLVTR
jgi:DNA-binding CsgD family transcriptional regulator